MELVSKIFETLEISQLALLQLGLVVVLALLLSSLLISRSCAPSRSGRTSR